MKPTLVIKLPKTKPPPAAKKPRRKAIRASALSRHEFEKLGYTVGFVERWIQQIKQRVDLFGFIDLIAYRPDRPGCVGIQSCAIDRWADHREKILTSPKARAWVKCNRLILVGWKRAKVRGQRNQRKHEWITTATFESYVPRPKTLKPKTQLIRY